MLESLLFFSDKKKENSCLIKYAINDLPKKFNIIGLADDNTIELFKLKKKYFGIMWHPERQKKISKIEKNLLKKYVVYLAAGRGSRFKEI